jgi:hypothetical protein
MPTFFVRQSIENIQNAQTTLQHLAAYPIAIYPTAATRPRRRNSIIQEGSGYSSEDVHKQLEIQQSQQKL